MSMSQKRKVKELEEKVDQILEYIEIHSHFSSDESGGRD